MVCLIAYLKTISARVCLAEISLDVDADRDGVVEKNNPNKVSRCITGSGGAAEFDT